MGIFEKLWVYVLLFVLSINAAYDLQESDQQAIQQIITNYTKAWNETEGKGFADGFAEDADFVNIFGMHFAGKAEIELRHKQILQNFL